MQIGVSRPTLPTVERLDGKPESAPMPDPRRAPRKRDWAVLAEHVGFVLMALAIVGFAIVQSLYVDRMADVEEIVLANPAYTFATEGRASFPVFSFMFGPA